MRRPWGTLHTDWPELNDVWNQGDFCEGEHRGPWIVLIDTDARRCLRCVYAEAFLQGMAEGVRQADSGPPAA
jgi:hypothetical protein